MITGKKYQVKETSRRYQFDYTYFTLENVREIIVSRSGNHKLKTSDGKLHIVPLGWVHIEITTNEDWVF